MNSLKVAGTHVSSSSQPMKDHWIEKLLPEKAGTFYQSLRTCHALSQQRGVHSVIAMQSAGFHYTGNGDTVRCDKCEIEVSGWTLDMKPFDTHAQRSPKCSYVCEIRPEETTRVPPIVNMLNNTTMSASDGQAFTGGSTAVTGESFKPILMKEVDALQEIRKRTFSHWSHKTSPFSAQMIKAGFFYCNVDDRVICLYCYITCQQWIPLTDDPWKVHQTLSPKCPFVITTVKNQRMTSMCIDNDLSVRDIFTGSIGGFDKMTLKDAVDARLDLSISKRLVDQGFDPSIIKRCYEDQLRLKHDDFASESDLLIACKIRKQIETMDENAVDIIIPSVVMSELRAKEQSVQRTLNSSEHINDEMGI